MKRAVKQKSEWWGRWQHTSRLTQQLSKLLETDSAEKGSTLHKSIFDSGWTRINMSITTSAVRVFVSQDQRPDQDPQIRTSRNNQTCFIPSSVSFSTLAAGLFRSLMCFLQKSTKFYSCFSDFETEFCGNDLQLKSKSRWTETLGQYNTKSRFTDLCIFIISLRALIKTCTRKRTRGWIDFTLITFISLI